MNSIKLHLHPEVQRKLERLAKRDPVQYRRLFKGLRRYIETGQGDTRYIERNVFRLRIGDWRAYLYPWKKTEQWALELEWREEAYLREKVELALRRAGLI